MLSLSVIPLETLSDTTIIWVLFVLVVAAIFDIKSRTIPNILPLTGILVLLGLQWRETSFQPLSVLIGALLSLTLWRSRFIGGGDSKLLILVSAAFAPPYLFTLYLCISVVGSIQAGLALTLKQDKKIPYAVAIFLGTLLFLLWPK